MLLFLLLICLFIFPICAKADSIFSGTIFGSVPFSFEYGGKSSREMLTKEPEVTKTDGSAEAVYTIDNLQIKAECAHYSDTGAYNWVLTFTNTGSEPTKVISKLRALDITVPVISHIPIDGSPFAEKPAGDLSEQVLILAGGGTKQYLGLHWGEYKIRTAWLQENENKVFQNPKLIPCQGDYSPYFNINWGSGGIALGIGWAGNWTTEAARNSGMLRITAGLKDDKFNTYLKPGESVRSPRIIVCPYKGHEAQTGFTLFRRTMLNHLCPTDKDGRPAMIPLTFSAGAKESFFVDEDVYNSYLDAGLEYDDFEAYWFDAFFQQDNYPRCRGNYHLPVSTLADKDRFPHGIEPIAKRVKDAGKQLLIWFAPEVVIKGSYIDREHPEFVAYPPEDIGEGYYGLGNPEAYNYIVEYLDACIKTLGIDIFRTDSETQEDGLNEYYGETAPDRIGIAENKYALSLYRLWDELVERNPGLLIDNCAGGGNRLEPELCSRSFPMWHSDVNCCFHTDSQNSAKINQLITLRLTNWLPWNTGGLNGTDPYSIRSGFCSGISYNSDPRVPDFNGEELKKGLKECKELRKYAAGDFYVLEPGDEGDTCWCAWQYHLPETGEGYIAAFRRPESEIFGMTLRPRQIDLSRTYEIKIYPGYDMAERRIITGNELAAYDTLIFDAPGSLIVRYRMLP